MKVFISWSGEISRQIAEHFRAWLPGALQSVKPYFSPTDIEKGARWFASISQELEDTQVGIFCVTKESIASPWMMFEAGAISKAVTDSNVAVILFGIDKAEIVGPLQQFQLSLFNKAEMHQVFEMINSKCGESRLESKVLDEVFDMWWPRLEKAITETLELHSIYKSEQIRPDREILEEILELSRLVAKYTKKKETEEDNAMMIRALMERFGIREKKPLAVQALDLGRIHSGYSGILDTIMDQAKGSKEDNNKEGS